MANNKKQPLSYKRDKDKVELNGDPADVNRKIWFDMISKELRWLIPLIVFLIILPKASLITLLYNWAKSKLPFMTVFAAVAGWMLMLSG